MDNRQYDIMQQEVARLAELIRQDGPGAGMRWTQISGGAMAGDEAAKTECAQLLGRRIGSQLDLFNIMRAAMEAATHGERHEIADSAAQSVNVMADPARQARDYLANRLGSLRRERGLSQSQMARISGVPITTIQKLENGTNAIMGAKTDTTVRLARALGITVEDLIKSDGAMEAE